MDELGNFKQKNFTLQNVISFYILQQRTLCIIFYSEENTVNAKHCVLWGSGSWDSKKWIRWLSPLFFVGPFYPEVQLFREYECVYFNSAACHSL